MTKEELTISIEEGNIDKIISNLNELWRDELLYEDCFNLVLELFYSTEDKNLLAQIDWCMHFMLKKNTLEKALKIIKHEQYTYKKINKLEHLHNEIFHNNKISSQLYKILIMSEAKKYSQELMQLLDSTTIDISTLDLNVDEKIKMFYKTMGSICAYINRNMNICFQLLEDDELIKKDEKLLLVFVRFYGWNWMGTSMKFITEAKINSQTQKNLIDLLKLYIERIKEENFGRSISKDFDIDVEIVRAKRRVDLEQSKKIKKQSDERSVLANLFKTTHLLIGNKYSHFYEKDKKIYQNKPSKLQEFSYELEMPLDYMMNRVDFEHTLDYLLNGGIDETNN